MLASVVAAAYFKRKNLLGLVWEPRMYVDRILAAKAQTLGRGEPLLSYSTPNALATSPSYVTTDPRGRFSIDQGYERHFP